ncbi:hypothetical protein Tco_0039348 [Tanacetum coccineum]
MIEPRSDKESLEVEIAKEKEVEISKEKEVELTNVVIPVNVNDEDEEITDEVYKLKRREKGKIIEETRNSPIPTPIRSPRINTNLVSSDTEKLQELTDTPHTTSSSSLPHKKLAKTNRLLSLFKTKPTRFKRYKSFFHELQGRYGYLFAHLRARFMLRTPIVRPRDQDDPHDDAHPEGENSVKRQKTSEYKAYVSGESSFGQVFQEEQPPSTSGNQEQNDDFDFWTDFYASDDDEIPS